MNTEKYQRRNTRARLPSLMVFPKKKKQIIFHDFQQLSLHARALVFSCQSNQKIPSVPQLSPIIFFIYEHGEMPAAQHACTVTITHMVFPKRTNDFPRFPTIIPPCARAHSHRCQRFFPQGESLAVSRGRRNLVTIK